MIWPTLVLYHKSKKKLNKEKNTIVCIVVITTGITIAVPPATAVITTIAVPPAATEITIAVPTMVVSTVVVPAIVVSTIVIPSIVVSTIVIPSIVVPTVVIPSIVIPSIVVSTIVVPTIAATVTAPVSPEVICFQRSLLFCAMQFSHELKTHCLT